MPDFNSRIDNRSRDKLPEDNTYSNEDRKNGKNTHVTKGIHSYDENRINKLTLHQTQGEDKAYTDNTNNESTTLKKSNCGAEELEYK